MEQVSAHLKSILSEYARDIEADTDNEVVYFTLDIDEGADEWIDGHQSSAICYSQVDGEYFVVEFDIRIGNLNLETVKEAVESLSVRHSVHVDSVDSGHGSASTPHIRNYRSRIRIEDFDNFMNALHNQIENSS